MIRRLALLPALALLAGCPSFTTMGTARTMDRGRSQLYVAAGATTLAEFQRDPFTGRYQSFTLPSLEVGGRYAVTDHVEVGGKVWPLGAELDGKFALLRSDTPNAGLSLALAPGASFYAFSASGSAHATYVWLHAPLLLGVALPGGSELTIGPRLSDMLLSNGGEHLNVVFAGGSLGLAWRVAPGFRILPEVSFAYPIAAWVGGAGVVDLEPKAGIVQVNVGFLMGGD